MGFDFTFRRTWSSFLWMLVLGFAMPAAADQIYITNFTKSDNIYTQLNEQFPNTHGGSPFLFVPPTGSPSPEPSYAPNFDNNSNLVNNGIDFQISADGNGNDFAVVSGGSTLSVSPSLPGATSVYAIVSSFDSSDPGGIGGTFTATFTGTRAGGGTDMETFQAANLPDYYNGDGQNTSINETMTNQFTNDEADQTLFKVDDQGGAYGTDSTNGHIGNYDITELSFTLDPTLAADTLTQIQFEFDNTSDSVSPGGGLIYGITAVAPVPEPASLGILFAAGMLTFRRRPSKSEGFPKDVPIASISVISPPSSQRWGLP